MKLNRKLIINTVALAIVGLSLSSAYAATKPARVVGFTVPTGPKKILNVRKSGWRDPAFGDMGWTHSSDWGKFTTKVKNKIVTIKLVTKVAGLHPAITVWHRGKDDTAPDTYVVDHFYPQNANFYEAGAKDETTNKALGNISMKVVAYGYDGDGHKGYGLDDDGTKILTPPVGMNAIKDKISGTVTLTFKAAKAGNYMFVVGAFNPAAGINGAVTHEVETTVSVKH
ncbi:copper(I)-binding protein CorA [Crenothrix sp.]|uniref:copper(I)-binding protein CorA n=1 Tax=Crenothrix sp. TaxID=3100433 RepID=UPI00374CEDA8